MVLNQNPASPANMDKQSNRLGKVKEGKKKVLSIIESMLDEPSIDEKTLKINCRYLSKAEYEDVNVERSLIQLCGYPLCQEKIKDVTKKKYQISLAEHKVYDLEKRKRFCSDICFKASYFIRDQLGDEPFWMRTVDVDSIPDVDIYNGNKGLKGEVVELNLVSNEDVEEPARKLEKKPSQKPPTRSKVKISAPYIKEEQLDQLKDSMASLKIVEKNVVERNPSASPSQPKTRLKNLAKSGADDDCTKS